MTEFKARPTVYKGIQMRSRLEAGFAMWLDESRFGWEYEPRAFGSSSGQYLPDFLVHNMLVVGAGAREAWIEVKPVPPSIGGESSVLERQLSVIWDSSPGALVLNVWPTSDQRAVDPYWGSGVAVLTPMLDEHVEEFGAAGCLVPVEWCRPDLQANLKDPNMPRAGIGRPAKFRPWPDEWWRVGG